MEWMLMPLQRYADFSGRSRRMEYWMFALGYTIAMVLLVIVASVMSGGVYGVAGGFSPVHWIIVLFALALFIPSLAVLIRRFHDQDRSGWWVLLGLIPYLGGLILLVFMCIEGTRGENRFGPDPKGALA